MASRSSEKMKKKKRLLLKEERPHFFKIILNDSIPLHKLRIPRKFVQIYGDYLSSPVMLKVCSGGVKWRVEIVKSEGEVWLQDRWREFAEYYSVVEGSFLVFEFEKSNCEFNVIIFDKSATEIDYPLTSFSNDIADLDQEQVPQEPIKKKIKLEETSANTLDQYSPTTGNNKESLEKESRSKKPKVSFSDCREAKVAAKKLTSTNPSFQAQISSACLKSCAVYIPSSFIKNVKQETKYARLKVNNRWWRVKLIISPEFCRAQLSAGWAAFARDNSLKVGDVCTFQMINNTDKALLINVSIIRDSCICLVTNGVDREAEPPASEIPDKALGQFSSSRKRKEKSPLSSSQPRKKMKIHKEGSSLQSENAAFQIAITPSHLHSTWSRLDIPVGFARKYMKRNDGDAVLNVLDGKTWSLKYYKKLVCGAIRIKTMHSDWIRFARGNRLQVGDTCTFKLIDPDKSIFEVIISKTRKTTNLGKSKQAMRKESGAIECLGLEKPTLSNPPGVNPFFQVVMTSTHFKGGRVNVPRHFINNLEHGTIINNLEHGTRIARLQVEDRFWPVKLIIYPYCAKSIFSGCVSFARENSLKVGDVCCFELIDTQNLVIKVSISRDTKNI